MEPLQRLLAQLRQAWTKLSLARKITFSILAALCSAVVLGIAYWSGQTEYRVLYSDLAPEDAGAITAKLDSLGVSYKVASGGTTLLVPTDRVQKLRLELAVEGLPVKGAGKGFELFDGTSLGSTPFTEHVNYLRALQGELAKTIGQIEAIASARVHIVRPEPSPFIREQKPTTASVVLHLKPGASLQRNVAAGIAALVARSVEGLSSEQVTILDTSGRVLSENNGDVGQASSQLDYRLSLERALASKAEEMLERVLGPGRAIVRVTAHLNFQKLKETRETYDPEGRVLTSEKVTTTKSTTSGSGARGAVGTASNLPVAGGRGTQAGASSTGASSNSQEETTETGYAVSRTVQELEDRVGNVERLTVAALVDLSGGGGAAGQRRATLSAADATELIKQAVGFKADRDEIKVSDVQLPGPAQPEGDDNREQLDYWRSVADIVRNASLGLSILVAVVLGWLAVRQFRQAAPPAPAPAPSQRLPSLDRLSTVARKDPEAIARVLAGWLEPANGTNGAHGRAPHAG